MNDSHDSLKRALWASTQPGHQHAPMLAALRASPPTAAFNEAVISAGKAHRCEKNPEPYIGEVRFSFETTASDDDQ